MAKLEEMQTVYTKYPDIVFLAEPKIGGRVFKRLENRTSMMWLAGAFTDKGFRFHKVSICGKVGYVAETAITLSPDPPSMAGLSNCPACNGVGHLPMPAGWEAYAGQALFPMCRTCNGSGRRRMSAQAFSSSGGTKG
jgi:hypothetical protein